MTLLRRSSTLKPPLAILVAVGGAAALVAGAPGAVALPSGSGSAGPGSVGSLLPGTDVHDDAPVNDGTDSGAPYTLATEPVDDSTDWAASYRGTFELGDADTSDAGDGEPDTGPVGGLSGIDRVIGDGGADSYIGLSDDRGEHGPARVYPLDITVGDDTGVDGVTVDAPIILTDEDGEEYPESTVDPEAVRSTPDGGFLWASEGDRGKGIDASVTQADATGQAQTTYRTPGYHHIGRDSGTRDNLAYEGLTLTQDESQAAVLTETPLTQDSYNRLTFYDTETGEPARELAYQLDPVDDGADGRGATEILAAGDDSFLTLERGYIEGVGTQAVLYRVTLDGATDVLGQPDLSDSDGPVTPVHKERLLDLSSLTDSPDEEVAGGNPDNTESLAWGPDGELLIGTDDNFSDSQRTLIHTVDIGSAE